jgi:hypothetical protein
VLEKAVLPHGQGAYYKKEKQIAKVCGLSVSFF